MQIINPDDVKGVPTTPLVRKPGVRSTPILTEAEEEVILKKLDHPVQLQQEIATKLHGHILYAIGNDTLNNGFLTESTRKWVTEYNELLDRIHKNLHGEKSVNFHLHKFSHTDLAAQIRANRNQLKEDKKKKEDSAENAGTD